MQHRHLQITTRTGLDEPLRSRRNNMRVVPHLGQEGRHHCSSIVIWINDDPIGTSIRPQRTGQDLNDSIRARKRTLWIPFQDRLSCSKLNSRRGMIESRHHSCPASPCPQQSRRPVIRQCPDQSLGRSVVVLFIRESQRLQTGCRPRQHSDLVSRARAGRCRMVPASGLNISCQHDIQ